MPALYVDARQQPKRARFSRTVNIGLISDTDGYVDSLAVSTPKQINAIG